VYRLPTDLRCERTAKRTQAKVAAEHLQMRYALIGHRQECLCY
jgi:hypothetical protein